MPSVMSTEYTHTVYGEWAFISEMLFTVYMSCAAIFVGSDVSEMLSCNVAACEQEQVFSGSAVECQTHSPT